MSVQKYQFCPSVIRDADLTWQHSIKPMSVSPPDGSLNIPLNDVFVGLKKKKQIVKDACIYEKIAQQVDLEKRYNNNKTL